MARETEIDRSRELDAGQAWRAVAHRVLGISPSKLLPTHPSSADPIPARETV